MGALPLLSLLFIALSISQSYSNVATPAVVTNKHQNHELHVAVKTDDIDSVAHLLRGGVDPNVINKVTLRHIVQ